MRTALIVIGLILFIAFLSASFVLAESNNSKAGPSRRMPENAPRGGAHSAAGGILRLKQKLELTDDQVAKLEAIEQTDKATNEAVKTKRQALADAVKNGASEQTIRTAAAELGNAMGDEAVLRVTGKTQVDAILTDTQKSRLDELRQNRDSQRQRQPQERTDRAGTNRDPHAIFDRIDSNGDGVISFEEFQSHAQQMSSRMGQREMQPGGQRGPGAGQRAGQRRRSF